MAEYELVTSEEQLDDVFDCSSRQQVLVFKHSLTCPISSRAKSEYDRFLSERSDGVRYALIEIQNHRPLSNAVAERTGVRHESPQALLLGDGAASWNASHGAITVDSLRRAIDG